MKKQKRYWKTSKPTQIFEKISHFWIPKSW